MNLIIKTGLLVLSLALVFISFTLAGEGQDSYFYTGCGFGLAGILVFMLFMRPGGERKSAAAAGKLPVNSSAKQDGKI